MKKEQIINALYEAKTEESAHIAHGDWLSFYQNASEPDKEYLYEEYLKYGEHIFEQNAQSRLEMQELLAEFEAMKTEENQHSS